MFDVYNQLDISKIQTALDSIISNDNLNAKAKLDLLNNSWRVNYRLKPPTPEEFLTAKYLGPVAESIYPRVRKWFIEFMNDKEPYRDAVLYTYIGSGKTTLSVLINLYMTVHLALMRDPKKYFGIMSSETLSFVLFT